MSTAAVTSEPDQPVNPQPQPLVAICEHIKDNGRRCGTPAIRGRHFCYYHSRAHTPSRLGSRYYRGIIPETIESLQLAIMQITEALGSGRINDKTAGRMLYSIQLSTNLLKMSKADKQAEKQALAAPSSASVAEGGVVDSELPSPAANEPVTEISEAMRQALTPRVVEPIDEPQPIPAPITRREFEEAVGNILKPEQIEKISPALGDGVANPGYPRALRKINAHYEALQRLRDAGIHRDDPRVQIYLETRTL